MGRRSHHRERSLTLEDHSPGCMSGILHHFHHQRRHHKRLHHRRHGSAKPTTVIADAESIRTASEAAEMQEIVCPLIQNNAVGVTKSTEPSPSHKSSMKSRIKALISEEMSKRRGRHRRSSSYPARTPVEGTNSVHHLDSSSQIISKSEPLDYHNNVKPTALLYPPLPKVVGGEEHSGNNSSCELCRQPVRDHAFLKNKYVYAMEQSQHATLQESKLFLDALDLLNMRKEVFLKILQDPSSSLAQGRRGPPNLRSGLTKSVSFPVPGSSDRRASTITKKENEIFMENSIPEQFSWDLDLNSPTNNSANMLRKQHENKVALKRFKNLKDKIKHVIRERKKEKHRIVMDAVFHKIPYGRRVSKEGEDGYFTQQEFKGEKYGKYSPRSSCGSDNSDFGNSHFKRTSSFNESSDRYNRLLEISYSREAKYDSSESLRTKTPSPITKSFGRILSLPDLRSYSYFHMDESPSDSLFETPARFPVVGSSRLSEQKPLGLENNKIRTLSLSESGSQENFLDAGETLDDSADSKTWESASCHDSISELFQVSANQSSKSDETDFHYQEDKSIQTLAEPISEDSELGQNYISPDEEDSSALVQDLDSYPTLKNKSEIEVLETQAKKFYEELFHVQVDIKNKSEFNYVKNVLELSGFSRNEILGKWHSKEHPLNPSVFEEVEGCLVAQPDCSGNEEGGSCDHLLLFDLINEVLLSIYERSFCYWPEPLTCRSDIRRMPMGHHVLEEVWGEISHFLSWRPEIDLTIDDVVIRDLAKGDGWMNLQFDGECVGLEVEDLIFDELLEEIVSN